MCSLLVRRAVLEEIGGAEDDFRTVFEDAVLLSKLHLRATAVISDEVTARYRQHPASACARAIAAGRVPPGRAQPGPQALPRMAGSRTWPRCAATTSAFGPLIDD